MKKREAATKLANFDFLEWDFYVFKKQGPGNGNGAFQAIKNKYFRGMYQTIKKMG